MRPLGRRNFGGSSKIVRPLSLSISPWVPFHRARIQECSYNIVPKPEMAWPSDLLWGKLCNFRSLGAVCLRTHSGGSRRLPGKKLATEAQQASSGLLRPKLQFAWLNPQLLLP